MNDPRLSLAPTRRDFCQLACLAVAGSALAGCSAGPTAPTGGGDGLPTMTAAMVHGAPTVTVEDGSPLASIGRPVLVQAPGASYLVTRTNHDSFVALTAQCTHYICMVSNFDGSVYECPCHGSQFDVSGRVVRGPATKPLQQFSTAFNGNTLTISA